MFTIADSLWLREDSGLVAEARSGNKEERNVGSDGKKTLLRERILLTLVREGKMRKQKIHENKEDIFPIVLIVKALG